MDKQKPTMMFNPYSGRPRDPRDIASDPAGLLLMDADEVMYAAPKAQPTTASDDRALPPLPTPDSYLFQHEETGVTQCVDGQQVEWGFENNNPRLQRIGGMFTESQMQAYARAALAPSPGVDAGKQKPSPGTVAWVQNGIANFIADNWPMRKHTLAEIEAGIRAIEIGVPPVAAPSPAASADTDKRFPFYELRFIMRFLSHEGSAPKEDWQTAYGMARAVFERWSKDRNAAPVAAASADEWMAEAEHLADEYAKSFHDAVNGPSYARKLSRAALLAHLKARPAPADECRWLGHTATRCPGGPKCDLLKKGDE